MVESELNGGEIKKLNTLSSFDDKGIFIELNTDKGEKFRIDVNEFLKLLNEDVILKVNKKNKHSYLTIEKNS
jgi:hypothetical protein